MAYTMGDRGSRGEGSTVTVGQFFRLLGRRRVALLVTVLVCLAVAMGLYAYAERTYQATAQVDVTPDPASGVDPKTVSTVTEQSVVTSSQVAAIAKKTLQSQDPIPILLQNVSVSSPLNSLVLNITYSAPTAREAADGANAFANGYISYELDLGQRKLAAREDQISSRISELTNRLNALPPNSDQRSGLASQIQLLQTQLNQIKYNTVIDTGTLIDMASPPTSASSPRLVIYGAGGLVLGLLVGVAVAVTRDRRDDSVRTVDDVESAVAAPVLAVLPFGTRSRRRAGTLVTVDDPLGVEADAFRTLALKLVRPSARKARATGPERVGGRPGEGGGEQGQPARSAIVIALLGVDQSGHSAIDLAVVLSRQRIRAALVGTSRSIAEARGLLTGINKDTAAHLTLVSAGDELDLDGLLRSVDSPLAKVEGKSDVILLDGVSVEHASTALSLAQYADGCLVFATVGTTTRTTLRAIAQEVAQIGGHISGAAVLYRARRGTAASAAPRGLGSAAGGGKATQHGRPIIAADLGADDSEEGEPARQRTERGLRRPGTDDRTGTRR